MFVLEYSICDSKDGLENWEDHRVVVPTLEQIILFKKDLRSEHKGALVVFEDVYEENDNGRR